MKKVFRSLLLGLCLLGSACLGSLSGQTRPLWLRYAQVSPDGQTVLFTYKGDIFSVSIQGGRATRLTATPAYETSPIWSPDGRQIAFVSDRDGVSSIYSMPAMGGMAKRITFNGYNHTLLSYSSCGKYLLFSAYLQDPATSAVHPNVFAQVYKVPLKGGIPQLFSTYPTGHISFKKGSSTYVLEDFKGFENTWRKHHTSSVTRDIYVADAKTKKRTPLTLRAGEDLNPVFSADGNTVYFLSERNGNSLNVWEMSATQGDRAGATQITHFKDHPVRFLSVANNGTLVYTYDGEIYTQQKGSKPQRLNINIVADFSEQEIQRLSMSSGATAFAASPNGKEIAVVVRGDIFVSSVAQGTTKQITKTPEEEVDILFTPDGRSIIYSSYRNGKYNLYKTSLADKEEPNFFTATLLQEEELIAADKSEKSSPKLSPNGKELAYLSDRKTLKVFHLEDKTVRTITDQIPQADLRGAIYYDWSPDSKWLAINYISRLHAPYYDVGIVNVESGEIRNITNSGYFSFSPKWVMNGDALIFISEKYGMRNHASWGSMNDVLIAFMNRKAYEKHRMDKEQYDLYMASGADSIPALPLPSDAKADTAKTKDIIIEWENIEDRVMLLTPNSSDLADAYVDNKGENLYYLTSFEGGYNLWMQNLRERKTEMLRKLELGNASLLPDAKGEKLYIVSPRSIQSLDLATKKIENISYRAVMELDAYAERKAMMQVVKGEVAKRFYRKDMHGVNWEQLTEHYSKFLPHIACPEDFSEMLSELLGELNVSHTGSGFRSSRSAATSPADLGLVFDLANLPTEGIRISGILPNGPLDTYRSEVKVGDYLVAIDGERIVPEKDFYQLLMGKVDVPTRLTFARDGKEEEFHHVVRPVPSGRRAAILYREWVKKRAAEVEKLSGGRLGYVHISSMDDASFRTAYSEVLGRYNLKEGIVIDIRYNGGGRLHEDLEVFFSGTPYLMQDVRGEDYCVMPSRRWTKPSVMLVCEADYSNAHGSPWVYQTMGIGKVVGMPVPGTMTSVNWEPLQDRRLYFGIPVTGYRTVKGEYLENKQLEPDVIAPQNYDSLEQGADEQLKKAVEVLLQQIDSKPKVEFPKSKYQK